MSSENASGGEQSRLEAPCPRTAAWCRVARTGMLTYALVCLGMIPFENQFIYFPSRYPDGDWELPRDVEEAHFLAADGTPLHGWFWRHRHPRAVILFAHGNGGNLTYWNDAISVYRDRLRASILIFDYRGYGRSSGSPDEAGILMDARAARDWLVETTGVPHDQLVLMGQSLGGAVMADLAANGGARGLILDRTFDSLPAVAAHHFPGLPVRWLMRTRLNAAVKIRDYKGPLLQLHGDPDDVVPVQAGRRLFQAANEPKEFVLLPGLGHNDLPTEDMLLFLERFIQGLSAAASDRGEAPKDTAASAPAEFEAPPRRLPR